MGSSRPADRSLGEATFLPQWMKGKLESRFDYSDSAFSPPADDPFFFIRYPKHRHQQLQETAAAAATTNANTTNKESFRPISELISGKSDSTLISNQNTNKDIKNIDFSKHPAACQPYIPLADKVNEPKVVVANKPKYKKIENDFHNVQAAECGRSIVHVANQIMSSKFGISMSADSSSSSAQPQTDESVVQTHQQHRKGSKSLPVTPLTSPNATPDSSPKARRRVYGNRFFAGAFVPSEDNVHKNGWLLRSILGTSREIIVPKIEEEEELNVEQVPAHALSRKKSISSQNLTYFDKDDKTEKQIGARVQILKAKPSELREMNFWSPTSM